MSRAAASAACTAPARSELTRRGIHRVNTRDRQPVMFYLHPWELDPDHPRVPFYWKAHVTHYVNLAATRSRLSRLLDDFAFGPLGEVLDHEFA